MAKLGVLANWYLVHRGRSEKIRYLQYLRPFPNHRGGDLMHRRFLVGGRKYESMKPGGSKSRTLGRILKNSPVTRDEYPILRLLAKVVYPINISRIATTWQAR